MVIRMTELLIDRYSLSQDIDVLRPLSPVTIQRYYWMSVSWDMLLPGLPGTWDMLSGTWYS